MKKHLLLFFLLLGLTLQTPTFVCAAAPAVSKSTVHAKDRFRIACVGNSITYGSNIPNREVNCYPAVLGRLLGTSFDVTNFGVSGRTCLDKGDRPYRKEKKFQEALDFLPNVVIIKLGTNDTKPQNWIYSSEYAGNLASMVRQFQQLASAPRVYLCYPATAYSTRWGINDSIIVNSVIPAIDKVAAETGVSVIDLHKPTQNLPDRFPDQIHPNAEGARLLAEVVATRLLNDAATEASIPQWPVSALKKNAQRWLKSREWSEGITLKPNSLVDAVEFQREYSNNPAAWKQVFQWLKQNDPATVAVGKYILDSANVTVTVTDGPSVRDFSQTKWEAHQQWVDLQYIAAGKERMGLARVPELKPVTPYNRKKDVGFYQVDASLERYVDARPGSFLLFFPSDLHRPNIMLGDCKSVRKIVFKVRSCWAEMALQRTL